MSGGGLQVGATNRAGTLEIVSREWDHNGTLTVTVACPFPRTAKSDEAARRLARRAIKHPHLTRSSRLTHVAGTLDPQYRVHVTFAVSRLPR